YRRPIRANIQGTQTGFGLRFEYRLLHLDADRRHNRGPDIGRVKILFVKLADGFHNRLPQRGLMSATRGGMLSAYERVVLFPVLTPVGHGHFRSEEHTSELQSRENLVCR